MVPDRPGAPIPHVPVDRRTFLRGCALGTLDVALGILAVGADYQIAYRSQRSLGTAGASTSTASATEDEPWQQRFSEHFSSSPAHGDASYSDATVSVTLTSDSYDSGVSDTSSNHAQYGTRVSYTLADVYVSGISHLSTAFAEDTYGVGYLETPGKMALRSRAALAINGDSYSNNRHRNNGTIIRNGQVYRKAAATDETCVLYRDGTMRTLMPEELDPDELVADGAWQTWVFGPSLLDAGSPKDSFFTWDYIRESHPRSAIGYYEPGHYCLLEVKGRSTDSRGMFLGEMADLFSKLGCQVAYNLDGGSRASMVFPGGTGQTGMPGRSTSDCILVCGTSGAGLLSGVSA